MLRRECKSERKSADQQSRNRRTIQKTIQGIHDGNGKTRDSHVGRHQTSICDEIRIERDQARYHQRRSAAKCLIGPQGTQDQKNDSENRYRTAGTEQNSPCIVLVKQPSTGCVCRCFRRTCRQRHIPNVLEQQWNSRNELHQRRMFWIGSEVSIVPILVTGKNVHTLVDRLGIVRHRQEQLRLKNSDEHGNNRPNSPLPGRGRKKHQPLSTC